MIPLIFTVEVCIVTNSGYTCNVQNKYARNRIKFCGLVSFHHMFLFSLFLVFKFKIKIEPKCKMKIHADKFYWECIFEMKDWNRFNRCKGAKMEWSVANFYMMLTNIAQWVYGYELLLLNIILQYMDFNVHSVNAIYFFWIYRF